MASTLRHIDLPVPVAGMNTDASPSQIPANQTPFAYNVVLNEPGQMRTRAGWVQPFSYANRYTAPASSAKMVRAVGFHYGTTSAAALMHLLDGSATNFAILYYDSLVPTSVAANTARFEQHVPTGQYIEYNGVTYYVAVDFTTPHLAMWAGNGEADITAGGITINNGSKTGTLSTSVGAAQLSNRFLTVTGGATGPLAGYRYTYLIRSGTGTTVTLHEPYGLGENTTNVPNAVGASTTISIQTAARVPNCPTLITSVGLFRDRIFTGGGYLDSSLTTIARNAIKWCEVGQPQKWPSANFILIGESGDAIVALGSVADGLLIFSDTKTWILTGYDEDSFTVRQLSGAVGCAIPSSVHYANGVCYWMADDGIYMSAGGPPISLTQPKPGMGIKSFYQLKMNADAPRRYPPMTEDNRTGAITVVNDSLIATVRTNINSVRTATLLQCDLRTGAWTTWGAPSATAFDYNPSFFLRRGATTVGLSTWTAVDITDCFGPERFVTDNARLYDANMDSAGAAANTPIEAEIRFPDVRLTPSDTVRVRGVQIDHNCHYTTGSPRVAWAVTLDVDADIDETALVVGNVDARLVTAGDRLDKYFTSRFTGTSFPTEGAVFRVRMVKSSVQTVSAKIFRVALVTDGQATFAGRVDNATT